MNFETQKAALNMEREKLELELDLLGKRTEAGTWMVVPDENQGNYADPIDNADITEDFEEKIARLNILETQRTQVLKALSSLEDDTYGTCEVCKGDINEKRIQVNPSSTTCIDHAK